VTTKINRHESDKRFNPAHVVRFDYRQLQEQGFACFKLIRTELVVAFRGTGLIDVFDGSDWRHIAFLDFDLQREIHLDSAFGSPLIGLPFSAALKHEKGVSLHRFDDLRRRHHYGFFVENDFRNGGSKGVWNLDELMMAIALEYAEDRGVEWFHIKPTGDTVPYYRRKYGAVRLPPTGVDTLCSIRLGPDRKPLPHVRAVTYDGRTRYCDVETGSDAAWPCG